MELAQYSLGLAYFRAGDHERAQAELAPVIKAHLDFPPTRMAQPVLALTSSNLGNAEEAHRLLSDADQTLQEWTTALENGDPSSLPVPWFDYLEFVVLYGEAHEVIRGIPPPADDRLAKLENRALDLLTRE
jgi:hypothetical protein